MTENRTTAALTEAEAHQAWESVKGQVKAAAESPETFVGEIDLGKVDYNGSGRRNCRVTIEVRFIDGRLSFGGDIWNPRETDCYQAGQCYDTIENLFPTSDYVARIVEVWRRWHLNDVHAGTQAQEDLLRQHRDEYVPGLTSYHEWACLFLQQHDLLVDDGYKYGSGWVREEVPAEIQEEVRSWIDGTVDTARYAQK